MSITPQSELKFRLSEFLREGSYKVALDKGLEAKTALSVPALVEQTNEFSTENRPGCQPKLLKSDPKDLFLHYNVKCNLKTSDPNGHDVKIHFDVPQVADGSRATDLDVKVSCSCPAELYWGAQWNLHQRDSLEGEPRPLLTAPTQDLKRRDKFVICKHLAAVCERILPSVQHNIDKIIRRQTVERNTPIGPENLSKKELDMRKRQEAMRDRLKKEKTQRRKNLEIQKKLLEGVRLREQDNASHNVVERDTPSTPEEQDRVPVVAPSVVVPPKTKKAPRPVTPSLKTPPSSTKRPVRDESATTHKPLPTKPQKLPRLTTEDKLPMDELLRQEKAKTPAEDGDA